MTRRCESALAGSTVVVCVAACFACGGAPTEPRPADAGAPAPTRVTVALRLVEAERASAEELASTRILLVDIDERRGRRTTDVGTYGGICSARAPERGTLLEVECFGSGMHVVVRQGHDRLEAWRFHVDANGARGEPELAGSATLPENARVETAGSDHIER